MRNYFVPLKENYVKAIWQTKFITQFTSFCIALILAISIVQSVIFIYTYEGDTSPKLLANVKKEWMVQLIISLLFISRFALLFVQKEAFLWISQIFWLIIYLMLISQIHSEAYCTKNMLPIFVETLAYIFTGYILLSPLRQLLTFFYSVGKTFFK